MTEHPGIKIIAARSTNGVVGDRGKIPWHSPTDLRRFKALTNGGTVIMGRRTWVSLPKRPLPGRRNVVLTRSQIELPNAVVMHDLGAALAAYPDAWVIGGADVYRQALPYARWIFLTMVETIVEGDTTMPPIDWRDWDRIDIRPSPHDVENDAGEPGLVFFTLHRFGEPQAIPQPNTPAVEQLPGDVAAG